MRRRTALAGLAGLVAGLAGCRGNGNGSGGGDEAGSGGGSEPTTGGDASVTPAPVPSADRTASAATPSPAPPCPELPTHAEVYVCSATLDPGRAGLELRPTRASVDAGGAVAFRLSNRSGLRFVTGNGWWTLARRDGPDWRTVTQGTGDGTRAVTSGGTATWRLRVTREGTATAATATAATTTAAASATPRPRRVRLPLSPGEYAFSVTGYFPGGELTALIAPFAVGSGTTGGE